MKSVYCILNGLSDRSLQDLHQKTPLEKAKTPHMDSLAKQGESCSFPPSSSPKTSLMELLTGDTTSKTLAEGPLNALSLGIQLTPQQVAYACRWVSTANRSIVSVSEALVSDSEGPVLCKELNHILGSSGWHFFHLKGCHGVVVSEHPLCPCSEDLAYPHPTKIHGQHYLELLPTGFRERHADVIRVFEKTMSQHEINALRKDLEEDLINGFLLYGGGCYKKSCIAKEIPKTLVLSETASTIGLAKAFNLDYVYWKGEAKKYDTVFQFIESLPQYLHDYERVVVEWNYLWNSTFKGDLLEKIKGIEWLDRFLIQSMQEICSSEQARLHIFPLTATSIHTGSIVGDPIPCLINPSRNENAPHYHNFTEANALSTTCKFSEICFL